MLKQASLLAALAVVAIAISVLLMRDERADPAPAVETFGATDGRGASVELFAGAASPADLLERVTVDAPVAAPIAELAAPTAAPGAAPTAAPNSLLVRALDPAGAALDGLEVVALRNAAWVATPMARAITDAAGLAVLELPSGGSEPPPDHVTLMAVGAFDPRHARVVDVRAQGVHELVVDVGGAVEVEVLDGTGVRVDGLQVMVMTTAIRDDSPWVLDETPKHPLAPVATTERGVARFSRVASGARLHATVIGKHRKAYSTALFDGPAAGETARVTLRAEAGAITLVGSVAEAGVAVDRGRPTPGELMWELLRLDAPWEFLPAQPLEVAEGWSFELVLEAALAAELGEHTWLVVTANDVPRAWWPLADHRDPGRHDLGIAPGSRFDVFAAGVARYDDGRPFGSQRLRAEVRIPGGPWRAVPGAATKTQLRGRFRATGVAHPSLEWRLVPELRIAELIAPTTIRPGEQGIDLRVRALPTIRGQVLVDAALGASEHGVLGQLRVVAYPVTGGAPPRDVTVGSDGAFVIDGAPGPVCRVEVGPVWHRGACASVEHAIGADPIEFDLRGRLSLATVTATGPNGEPLAFRARPSDGAGALPMHARSAPQQTFLLHDPPMDLVVGAAGFSDVLLEAVDGDRTVRFERPDLPVELTWRGIPEVASDVRLRPVLVPARAHVDDGPTAVYLADVRDVFDAHGSARVRAPGAGRYVVRLQVEVVRDMGRAMVTYPIGPHPEIEVIGGDAPENFEVAWERERIIEFVDMLSR